MFGRFRSTLRELDEELATTYGRPAKQLTDEVHRAVVPLTKAIARLTEDVDSSLVKVVKAHGSGVEGFIKIRNAMFTLDKNDAEELTGPEWIPGTAGRNRHGDSAPSASPGQTDSIEQGSGSGNWFIGTVERSRPSVEASYPTDQVALRGGPEGSGSQNGKTGEGIRSGVEATLAQGMDLRTQ